MRMMFEKRRKLFTALFAVLVVPVLSYFGIYKSLKAEAVSLSENKEVSKGDIAPCNAEEKDDSVLFVGCNGFF